jgi:gas vesicle protein|tara:strand:+ start:531 stop:884 length:354 start_codon:yes stop_codon:yes gene_type:complete
MGDTIMTTKTKKKSILDNYSYQDITNFVEDIYEVGFGADAIYKGYTLEEVLERIKNYSQLSWKIEDSADDIVNRNNDVGNDIESLVVNLTTDIRDDLSRLQSDMDNLRSEVSRMERS